MRLTMQVGIRLAGLNIFYTYARVEQSRSGGREDERPWNEVKYGIALIFTLE